MRQLSLILLLAGGLVACDGPKTPPSGATSASEPPATSQAAAAPVKSEGAAPLVNLDGEGLRLVDASTGHASPLPFGTPMAQTVAAIGKGMGGKPEQTGTNSDCGPGPLQFATWSKGLTAWFQDDKFVGWGGAVDLKTASGIGFGSTRADVQKAYDIKVEKTSLGQEFSAGGLSGVLESDAPDAQVSEIWAGTTCVMR